MRFDRYFTRKTPDPYEGVPFRSIVAENGLEMTVPASWGEAATTLLVENVLGQTLFPALRAPVEEKGVPLWLCPKAAEGRGGPEIFETDIRQVIDRLCGFWTYRGWKAGHFEGDAENARIFYDEIRHVLLHQMASPVLFDWAHGGFSWAYGVGAPDPASLPIAKVEAFDITASDALSRLSRKARGLFDDMARKAGRRLLLGHLDAVMTAVATTDYAARVAQARNAGVPEGALADAVLYARQGYKNFPVFDEDDQAATDFHARVRIQDSFMGAVAAKTAFECMDPATGRVQGTIDAGGLWQNLAGAVWSCGGLDLRFSSDRDIFAPGGDVYVPSCWINLAAFLPARAGSPFALEAFSRACRLLTAALDGLAPAGAFRPLGLGFAGLDLVIERQGLAYDSEQARAMAAGLAALMSGTAMKTSAELAQKAGSFSGYDHRRETFLSLLCRQRGYVKGIGGDAIKKIPVLRAEYCPDLALVGAAEVLWDAVVLQAEKSGLRNACVCVLSSDAAVDILLETQSGNVLQPEAKILMQAAVMPFFGDSRNETIALPRDISVESVADLMQLAWSRGLVNLSLYREGSEMQYPLSLLEMEEKSKAPPVPQKELVVLSEPPLAAGKKLLKKKKVNDGRTSA